LVYGSGDHRKLVRNKIGNATGCKSAQKGRSSRPRLRVFGSFNFNFLALSSAKVPARD
jgi:hypothetical protein